MHTLKITGDTPEALYFNVVKTLSMFLRGPQTTAHTETAPLAAEPTVGSVVEPTESSATAGGAATAETPGLDKVVAKAKDKKTARASKVEKMENDDISDVGAGKTIEHDADKKPLTLEADIIPRLQAIQAACTKRGMDMPSCVKYIQKLYGPFGIANAKQLKPDQFEEFLEASEAYLNGDA